MNRIFTLSARHLTTSTRTLPGNSIFSQSNFQSKQQLSTLPLNTLRTRSPTPSPFTESLRFAPTSKGWNKVSRQSQIDAKKRSWVKSRYHNTDPMSPFPKMTLNKFKHLPRPLFIESEVIDLFVPAPQFAKAATRENFTVQAKAAERPY